MKHPSVKPGRAFSIIELLAAFAILSVILICVVGMTDQTSRVWKASAAKIEAFQSARLAFESMTTTLSRATLNTYCDYYDSSRQKRTPANARTFNPQFYGRYSELEFVCGKSLISLPNPQVTHAVYFQAPEGLTADAQYQNAGPLLNAIGFHVEFGSNQPEVPGFLTTRPNAPKLRWRYRLMQFTQPTEDLDVYGTTDHSWFTDPLRNGTSAVSLLAENIIACIVTPKLQTDTTGSSIAPNFEYDSRVSWTSGAQPASMHQLPPLVEITLIAADEASMSRLQGTLTTPPDLGFDYAQVFQNAADLEANVDRVRTALVGKKVEYRVFQTTVSVRSARWSGN